MTQHIKNQCSQKCSLFGMNNDSYCYFYGDMMHSTSSNFKMKFIIHASRLQTFNRDQAMSAER